MNSNENTFKSIPKEKFEFVNQGERLVDVKLQTKPVGFFQDAMSRFVKNKGSVVCFIIIFVLFLYAIFAPLFSPYEISTRDAHYSYVTPKSHLFANTTFWDGGKDMLVNKQTYQYMQNVPGAIKKDYGTVTKLIANKPQTWHKIRVDTYEKVGWSRVLLTKEELAEAQAYEAQSGKQLFYPVIDTKKIKNKVYENDLNAWFLTDSKGVIQYDSNGNPIDIFLKDSTSKDGNAYFVSRMGGNQIEARVLYKEWYYYKNGRYPLYIFGTDVSGYDIFTRLAGGARVSLILSFCVAAINLLIGVVIGALEGYYGGVFDLIMERIKDILWYVPTVVTFALFQLYFAAKAGPIISLFFAFVVFGWIYTSSVVRAQFYRFKGQDYVNASRTLGAKDSRLIFKHILPNSLGYLITVSVLEIPGYIYAETTMTYLGIVNLESDKMTSVGAMLESAKSALTTSPHALFFPAAFIAILLVCFNEFGNGLRDAFNPSLRGTENA